MKKHLVYLLIIVGLLALIGFNRCGDGPETTVTERERIDSTVVDSLTKRIQQLESIPNPDTVFVEVQIPSTPDTVYTDSSGAQVKEFTSFHTDSVLVAKWTTAVIGELKSQNFEYSLRHIPVIRETTTKYLTQYRTIERTITKSRGGFLAVGGSLGFDGSSDILTPVMVEYHAKDGYSYKYTHIPQLDAHLVGLSIPIRIKIPFL